MASLSIYVFKFLIDFIYYNNLFCSDNAKQKIKKITNFISCKFYNNENNIYVETPMDFLLYLFGVFKKLLIYCLCFDWYTGNDKKICLLMSF